MLTDAPDFSAVRRVLVMKLRHHGDVLLTSPVFSALKNHLPHAEIDALVYHETREMLTLHPAIDNVFTVDRGWKRRGVLQQLSAEVKLLRTLRARRYDLLIHLTEHPRGAWLRRLLGVRYSVARMFAGRRGAWWRSSFSHLYPLPATPRHTVECHLDALRRIGIYPRDDERALVLVPGAEAENFIGAMLASHGLRGKDFIHFHPTSRWLFKCWEDEKCSALIDRLQAAGERVVVTAAPTTAEHDRVRRILNKVKSPVVDVSGQLNLKQLAALTRRAKCFVGVDSAPMHIAAAMQTPVVVLFGPSGEMGWGPWQVVQRVITSRHTCRPCGLDGCGGGKVSECLTSIPVERVLGAVNELLAI
ncbi:MAG: putative lipopolysaccharide heptosyltransferase III [Proteobacteria bacterium]|nr:putative lipopolysaccharide heptosyltransferase III [Pseudomonadota bacterium]